MVVALINRLTGLEDSQKILSFDCFSQFLFFFSFIGFVCVIYFMPFFIYVKSMSDGRNLLCQIYFLIYLNYLSLIIFLVEY